MYTNLKTGLLADLDLSGSYLEFTRRLHRFQSISLTQINTIAFHRRIDTKFVMTENDLLSVLSRLSEQYDVLEINGKRLGDYHTLYFDTADFALFQRHHAGARPRCKVRSRQYVDTGCAYFELKRRTNKNITMKERFRTSNLYTEMTSKAKAFVRSWAAIDPERLSVKLTNDYFRITMLHKYCRERLTLDLAMRFSNDMQALAMPGVAIAEVKQERLNRRSEFMEIMRDMNIRPTGISKYCIGVSLLHPEIKHNAFKPKLRRINNLVEGANYA